MPIKKGYSSWNVHSTYIGKYYFDEQIQFCQQTSNCCCKKTKLTTREEGIIEGKKEQKKPEKGVAFND